MGWERYVLALGPVFIIELAAVQTIATFEAQLLALLYAFKDWQALMAALIAIVGIGWQVAKQGQLSREQTRHNIDLAHAQERLKQISVVRAIYPVIDQAILNLNYNIGVSDAVDSSNAYSEYDSLVATFWDETEIELLMAYETRLGELDGATKALWAFSKQCRRIDRRIAEAKLLINSPRSGETVKTQMKLDQAVLTNALAFGEAACQALIRNYPEAGLTEDQEDYAAKYKELGKIAANDALKILHPIS